MTAASTRTEPGRAAILAAIAATGPSGLPHAAVLDMMTGRTAAARAGRILSDLAREGLVVKGKTGWAVTEKGVELGLSAIKRLPKHPGPLLHKLPDAPPDAKPPRRKTGPPSQIEARLERTRTIAERMREMKERGALTVDEEQQLRAFTAVYGIDDYELWLPGMFPRFFEHEFAPHHHELLKWAWTIEADKSPPPFAAIWNRGGAKSVLGEAVVVATAARETRKFCLYVSATQALADQHVGNIAGLLESPQLAAAYPALGDRAIGKFGESKAWRRNRLQTAAGFTVDALGLDVASRGVRIDENRPDLIVLDDIDRETDTPHTTEKKIAAITRQLLPAGKPGNTAVLFVQNMIHSQSIAARLARMEQAPEADYMARRIVSGPIPAMWDLTWAPNGEGAYVITGGTPSWVGMDETACQAMLDLFGLTGFLIECQHIEARLSGGLFDDYPFDDITVAEAEVPRLLHIGCWVDPAVTSTDKSDSCGLTIDGLGVDGRYYRLWSWERISSPLDAIKLAIRTAMEHGAVYRPKSLAVGVETDQGGDTWDIVFKQALRELHEEEIDLFEDADGRPRSLVPKYEWAKAGSTNLSKIERINRMKAQYQLGRFRHVRGRMGVLEAGLRRFPRFKPYDAADSSYWSWRWLAGLGGETGGREMTWKASRGQVPQTRPSGMP